MRSIERPDGHCLRRFAQGKIKKGAHLRTDGWGAYRRVAQVGYRHKAIVTGGGKVAAETFPWLHTFIANMKRMILGTYHSVSPKHLDNYLSEFDYRTNRRWLEANLFDRLIPTNIHYKHNLRWGDGNGHAHVRASLLSPSLTVPFVDRRLTLGTWQQIVFIDFDNRPRSRELVLQLMGE